MVSSINIKYKFKHSIFYIWIINDINDMVLENRTCGNHAIKSHPADLNTR